MKKTFFVKFKKQNKYKNISDSEEVEKVIKRSKRTCCTGTKFESVTAFLYIL